MRTSAFKNRMRWCVRVYLIMVACLAPTLPLKGQGGAHSNRKALVFGRGGPENAHPESAKKFFLRCTGNPSNDPAKGWTCDFTFDVMLRLGMDPTNTPIELFFRELGSRGEGYRIVMTCGPFANTLPFWGSAIENGLMPFCAQGNNNPGLWVEDPIGMRTAVAVAGGPKANLTSIGPGVEFIDALPRGVSNPDYEESVQSYASQSTAAKFALLLDAHPDYNLWDARQHLRQSASFWAAGWNATNGYGRPSLESQVGLLMPGPPVDFQAERSRDRHYVSFSWRNFEQSDFAATVIARTDGRELYRGRGSNYVWQSDVEGAQEFTYWSENRAGRKSRMETYQRRVVSNLSNGPFQSCLILGAPAGRESENEALERIFLQGAPGWNCDIAARSGSAFTDSIRKLPQGSIVAVSPGFQEMVTFAIRNHYRLLVAPVSAVEGDLYRYKPEWDRATEAGILAILPHHASLSISRKPQARRVSPPRLFSAITVGYGTTNNYRSFGPGLEFYDAPEIPGTLQGIGNQIDAAAVVAAKLARILDANPGYNLWDARQHLRQTGSRYSTGWIEDGGFGRPSGTPLRLEQLELAPPLEIQAVVARDGQIVALSWENFRQTAFARTVITRRNGSVIYSGVGTNYTWKPDRNGSERFSFYSEAKDGRRSRSERFTSIEVSGLRKSSGRSGAN